MTDPEPFVYDDMRVNDDDVRRDTFDDDHGLRPIEWRGFDPSIMNKTSMMAEPATCICADPRRIELQYGGVVCCECDRPVLTIAPER